MSATIIDGKGISILIRAELKEKVALLKEKGVVPSLTVILVGDDPGSQVYVRNKERACKEAGMVGRVIRMPAETTQEDLLLEIQAVNKDDSVHGLLVQLPLPGHLNEVEIIRSIAAEKDVDGLHPMTQGCLMSGAQAALPCTPRGCIELLHRAGVPLKGAEAVVVGRSVMVGKPMALLLLRENATVTICHSRTRDLGEVTRRADVLIVAIGKPNLITGDMIKPGAAVIDVGMNRLLDGTLTGDVDFETAKEVAGCITPVPGGVGPMTIAMLLENTIEAAARHAG
jgi:methylenetetrahydrofolate dehydrogenase (NADP+) / methenyltetrahydrofolate cyclohydrolase